MLNRRDFLGRAAAGVLALKAASLGGFAFAGSGSPRRPSEMEQEEVKFFQDAHFEFMFLVALGKVYQRAGDVGKLLYIADNIVDKNYESAYQAFFWAGVEAKAMAESSLSRGHKVSAREAFMWASNYFYSSTYFLDFSDDPSRQFPTWHLSRECWESAAALFSPEIIPVEIPYYGTTLSGYFYRCEKRARRRPLIIVNNGSDGSILDMWCAGASGALLRGYNCLAFDGPGQGASLWLQNLYFRHDWEAVIGPVLDFALKKLRGVDRKRVALVGVSQGGYWVPRAVAFEKRIAAAVADPGVWSVYKTWYDSLPPDAKGYLDAGEKEKFNAEIDSWPEVYRIPMQSRMRPYGITDYYDCFKEVEKYNLEGVVSGISCPMLVTNPENETFSPGQPRQLYNMLPGPHKEIIDFTAEMGADLHCEPKAAGLRDMKVFDWLDEQFEM